MAEAPGTTPLDGTDEPPSGPAAAALLASGIGALVLGIFTTWAEASTGMHDWLQWNDQVGPLTGKVVLAVIAFLGSWAVLGLIWKDKNPELRPIVTAAVVLVAVGFLMTFPTFFQAFA
jgi:hypothetical protein